MPLPNAPITADIYPESVVPFVQSSKVTPDFRSDFLVKLWDAQPIPETAMLSAYEAICAVLLLPQQKPPQKSNTEPPHKRQKLSRELESLRIKGYSIAPLSNPAPAPAPVTPKSSVGIDVKHLSSLLSTCETLKSRAPISLIVNAVAFSSAQRSTDPSTFGTFYLPLLKDLLSLVISNERTGRSVAEYATLFRSILSAYIKRYIRPEPRPPNGYTDQPPSHRSCGCKECQWLTAFLHNPRQPSSEMAMVRKQRDHISNQILDHRAVHIETIKSGSPHTLKLTKVHGDYPVKLDEWKKRINEGGQWLENLEGNKVEGQYNGRLKRLLGGEWYAPIWSLRPENLAKLGEIPAADSCGVSLPDGGPQPVEPNLPPQPLAQIPTNIPAEREVNGNGKRPALSEDDAQIIDLT